MVIQHSEACVKPINNISGHMKTISQDIPSTVQGQYEPQKELDPVNLISTEGNGIMPFMVEIVNVLVHEWNVEQSMRPVEGEVLCEGEHSKVEQEGQAYQLTRKGSSRC